MAQFCHDEYDHPLLWCDGKRRIVNQQDALLAMAKVKELKEQDQLKRITEQREYRDMTKKHCPWGRPGAGAPGDRLRRSNILAQGIFPVSRPDCRQYTLVDYGKSGRIASNPKENTSSAFQRMDNGHEMMNSHSGQVVYSGHQPPPTNRRTSTALMKLSDHKHPGGSEQQKSVAAKITHKPKPKTILPPMQCCCSKCCCNCGLSFEAEDTNNAKSVGPETNSMNQFSPAKRRDQPHHRNQLSKATNNGGGLESAPLLARRRAMQEEPHIELEPIESNHLTELCRQMKQKERREEIRQVVERHLSDQHFATLDSMWGRPGNGAPRPIKNKLNLDDLLYKVPFKADYVL